MCLCAHGGAFTAFSPFVSFSSSLLSTFTTQSLFIKAEPTNVSCPRPSSSLRCLFGRPCVAVVTAGCWKLPVRKLPSNGPSNLEVTRQQSWAEEWTCFRWHSTCSTSKLLWHTHSKERVEVLPVRLRAKVGAVWLQGHSLPAHQKPARSCQIFSRKNSD